MPTFDYRCEKCGAAFEAHVASTRSRPNCPNCTTRKSTRLPCAPAVRGGSPQAPILPTRGGSAHGCGAIERSPGDAR
ncbi:MAG: zinc ribbon domain-containing protein [Planctomycetes bacterium]|nr:zinc ribbon domain-containing protein [Planctomycetota bacterium]